MRPVRIALALTAIALATAAASAAVTVTAQTGGASGSAEGSSDSQTLPAATPGSVSIALGTPGPGNEFAVASATSSWTASTISLESTADIGHPATLATAGAEITLAIVVDEPTHYTFDYFTQAFGGGFTLYQARATVSLGSTVILDSLEGLTSFQECNQAHPDAALICQFRILPPGFYTITVDSNAFYPPDCGSCHGYTYEATANLDMTFSPCIDDDADGWCGASDNCPGVANPDQSDQDADGLGDACDPCPTDDADGDGICGAADNCPTDPNPDQADQDADGLGDVCDPCPTSALNDADGDGICEIDDPCPGDPVNDADGDGICEGADPCPGDPVNDPDGDGVCDAVDNCPSTPNPSQAESDGDGVGDACDPCPFSVPDDIDGDGICDDVDPCPSDASNDPDGDGHCSLQDNCPNVHNPLQVDSDLSPGGTFSQWAMAATASSEWSPTDYGAIQLVGPPENAGVCGDAPTSWSPATDGPDPEWVELTYEYPVRLQAVRVHETLEGGFVTRIQAWEPNGTLRLDFTPTDTTTCGNVLEIIATTTHPVDRVRLWTQIAGWEEIDAVELQGDAIAVGDGYGDVCDNCPDVRNADQSDLDADGAGDACDCGPADPLLRRPPAVDDLRLDAPAAGIARLSWGAAVGADSYAITRGTLAGLAQGDLGACIEPAWPLTELDDAGSPEPGEASVYLVRGTSAGCGPGPLGAGATETARTNANAAACP